MSMAGTDNLDDLKESMIRFEAAMQTQKVSVDVPDPKSILLALDGSNQDATAVGLAATLAETRSLPLHLTYAYEGPVDPAKDAYLDEQARSLVERGIKTSHSKAAGRSYEQILEVARTEASDLIVVCAPYLEDIGELGDESVGTNLDLLMSRSPVPVLVVRQPQSDPGSLTRSVLLPLGAPSAEDSRSAGWSVWLAGQSGSIRVLIVADAAALQRAGRDPTSAVEIDRLDDKLIDDILAREHAGLIGALQKLASEKGLGCRVSVRGGDPVEVIAEMGNAADGLVVLSRPTDRKSERYQRVLSVVRESANPVLIV